MQEDYVYVGRDDYYMTTHYSTMDINGGMNWIITFCKIYSIKWSVDIFFVDNETKFDMSFLDGNDDFTYDLGKL